MHPKSSWFGEHLIHFFSRFWRMKLYKSRARNEKQLWKGASVVDGTSNTKINAQRKRSVTILVRTERKWVNEKWEIRNGYEDRISNWKWQKNVEQKLTAELSIETNANPVISIFCTVCVCVQWNHVDGYAGQTLSHTLTLSRKASANNFQLHSIRIKSI